MKVLVCGGRAYQDRKHVFEVLDGIHDANRAKHIELLIHGAATGADTLADDWAESRGVQPIACRALWDYWGKKGRRTAAGAIRNRFMLLLEPDLLVPFPGGTGTADMVEIAKKKGIRIHNEETT